MTFSWYLELLSRKEILNLGPLAKQLSFLVFIPWKKRSAIILTSASPYSLKLSSSLEGSKRGSKMAEA